MNKKKQIVFKYFDMIFSGYKKRGRRPFRMPYPHVLYEYMNDDGIVAFEYNTFSKFLKFNEDDFYTAQKMFSIDMEEMEDICQDYIADKFNEPMLSKKMFLIRKLNF
jgi:uncharacterized protein Usg